MEAIVRSEYGTKSRAEVFTELCRILLHEEHEFREVEEPKEDKDEKVQG